MAINIKLVEIEHELRKNFKHVEIKQDEILVFNEYYVIVSDDNFHFVSHRCPIDELLKVPVKYFVDTLRKQLDEYVKNATTQP